LRGVDVKDVVLWLLAMMMESASNTTTEKRVGFSLMMENPSSNATDRSIGFAFKVFYF
jgi:hypothetical protein